MKLNRNAINKQIQTRTFEGAKAYVQKSEVELTRLVLTCMFGENSFYESANESKQRLCSLVDDCVRSGKAEFVAKLAVYARTKMNMRTVSIVLIVELAKSLRQNNESFDKMRSAVFKTISRADELSEIYAYALDVFGNKNKVPQSIKKGTADAFNKFDEYQLAKYNRNTVVKLKDVLKITHAKPNSKAQSDLFYRLLNDSLRTPDTWETKISTQGSNQDNWQEVANSKKTGFMAMLRNLNNFIKNDVDLTNVIYRLSDRNQVKKSKQFPYQIYSAYRAVTQDNSYVNPKLLSALETAMEYSVDNLPNIGNVASFVDVSGSMNSTISGKSRITCADISSVMGAASAVSAVQHGNEAVIVLFATDNKVIKVKNTDTVMGLMSRINGSRNSLGYGTDLVSAYIKLNEYNLNNLDNVLVFTDMQITHGYYGDNTSINKHMDIPDHCSKIAIDLQGYSANPMTERQGWLQLAGYSDKIFDFLDARNNLALLKDIKQISL